MCFLSHLTLFCLSFSIAVGNKRFREAVSSSLQKYMEAESRFEKSLVVHGIVDSIQREGGRFLKKDHKTGAWYELSRQQSKEKVGHAVRDAVNSFETRAKKKLEQQQEEAGGASGEGYASLSPSLMDSSRKKRMGTGVVFNEDYGARSRKRRRTASPVQPGYFDANLPGGLEQEGTGLAARLPSSLKRSPIVQHPQQQQEKRTHLHYSPAAAAPEMVASLPSNLQPSPINEQQRSTLDTEHHPRSSDYPGGFPYHSQHLLYGPPQERDLPGPLPRPPHDSTANAAAGGGASSSGRDLPPPPQQHMMMMDPQYDPFDPVARMQLMQMQQQRDHYFQHPQQQPSGGGGGGNGVARSNSEENDHFLDAINAVLGPLPDYGGDFSMPGAADPFGPQHQHPVDPSDPQHPQHPQHPLWLQQRMQRETLRRRQMEFLEEQQRRRRQQQPE